MCKGFPSDCKAVEELVDLYHRSINSAILIELCSIRIYGDNSRYAFVLVHINFLRWF